MLIEDATASDYAAMLHAFPSDVDYLSLDVDGYYDVVLQMLPHQDHIFKVITIEHDYYRFGTVYRNKERSVDISGLSFCYAEMYPIKDWLLKIGGCIRQFYHLRYLRS